MIKYRVVFTPIIRLISRAGENTIESLRDGRIKQEHPFTERLLGRIEDAVNNVKRKGMIWRAKSLTDRGRGAEEKEYGADFAGVFEVDIPGLKVKKGFLAQAKLIRHSNQVDIKEFQRMQRQCEKMLKITPDSYLFLYNLDGISVVPALSVASSVPINPYRLRSHNIGDFFLEHFSSFIGDRAIYAANIHALEEVRLGLNVRSILYLGVAEWLPPPRLPIQRHRGP